MVRGERDWSDRKDESNTEVEATPPPHAPKDKNLDQQVSGGQRRALQVVSDELIYRRNLFPAIFKVLRGGLHSAR